MSIGGFSVNFCRNPHCTRYGIFPNPHAAVGRSGGDCDHGHVTGSGSERTFTCPACGSHNTLKSNRAVAQEYSRTARIHRRPFRGDACKREDCQNFGISMTLMPTVYRAFGWTAKGDPRHQCKGCGGTFSIGAKTRRHKRTDRTKDILLNLVNKVPLSRICEINGVTFPQIYAKIDFIYRQCLAMAAHREKALPACFAGGQPIFATDAQTILLNWPVRGRRGTVPLLHMSTVHNGSQFVVVSTVDYDPEVSVGEVDNAMEKCGDFLKPRSMRQNARLWSEREYRDAVMRGLPGFFGPEDMASGGRLKLPGKGARVRGDAFMYAHVMLVRKMIGSEFSSAHFCLDADSGLAAAFCALSVDLVKSGQAHITEVSFEKGLTNDERSTLARLGGEAFHALNREHRVSVDQIQQRHPDLNRRQALVTHLMGCRFGDASIQDRGRMLATVGVEWPFHTKAEPRKSLRLKTDLGHLGFDGLARLICEASIHPVDAWFNLARRRVTGFERGLPTASNQQRIWHAYGFYDPDMVPKMVTILRFYHNWMLRGRDGATPAMRIGLAKGLIYPRDLFSF